MQLLSDPPCFLFFTGKGGVGKTSLACATAITLADRGKRVLLVSTDPASNVGQVLETEIGNTIQAIPSVTELCALEIDPEAAAQAYRDRIVTPLRGVLPDDEVNGVEEQLSGACTTEIAAFDEFTALLTDARLVSEYDHIIFDTAPTGHTIRLLQLPGAWSGFIEDNPEGASCLGPLAGLEKQRQQYHAAVAALSDKSRTRLVLVARGQASALREAARTQLELNNIGLQNQSLALNGLMPADEAEHDPLAAAIQEREQAAISAMPKTLAALPVDRISLKPFNLVGIPALRALFSEQIPQTVTTAEDQADISLPPLASLIDEMAEQDHGLIMVMGKGGVGKTTLAIAVALELARRGFPVHLTTSDPAAHLSEALDELPPQLTLSRIDPRAETEHYRQEVLARKGKGLDAAGRAMLEEDLRSPCTEEIAVFQAFSRIIREAGKKFVVMDTAPTGHTLLLLDATGAYHREIVRQMGSKTMHFTTPMMQLQDPARTKVLIATLAETTPVLEAAALQEDLRRAGIESWAWVINNNLAAAHPQSRLLQQRAASELIHIERVTQQHAQRYAVVAMQTDEPVGVERLHRLAQQTNRENSHVDSV